MSADTPVLGRVTDPEQLPGWFDSAVDAVVDVFEATGEKPDPSWRSLARQVVAAVRASDTTSGSGHAGVERLRRLSAVVAERDTYKNALERIVACPNPNEVEDCHDRMFDIAKHALASDEGDGRG